MSWSNKQYAEWMIEKGVPPATMCLAEVWWDEERGWIPMSVWQVSKRGIEGNDLFVPADNKTYLAMYYLLTKTKGEYLIGLGETKRHSR